MDIQGYISKAKSSKRRNGFLFIAHKINYKHYSVIVLSIIKTKFLNELNKRMDTYLII